MKVGHCLGPRRACKLELYRRPHTWLSLINQLVSISLTLTTTPIQTLTYYTLVPIFILAGGWMKYGFMPFHIFSVRRFITRLTIRQMAKPVRSASMPGNGILSSKK